MPTEKLCKMCNEVKPRSSFSITRSKYKGTTYENLQSYCKPCVRIKFNKWKDDNPQKCKKNSRMLGVGALKTMSGPISWNYLKGKSMLNQYKVYPLCEDGHRYVGPECLKCKYSVTV